MPFDPQAYRPEARLLALGDAFYDRVRAADFPETRLRFRNDRAAAEVGLAGLSDEEWTAHFGRFAPLPGSLPEPLALRYHGHQFRVYNPEIGDGRGFTFAQLRDEGGRLMDFGTKGSGPTPWSRFGDGRLTLKGGVREVLATEMLEALGVHTSRSFSLIETGEALQRNDEPSPTRSAVLVRLSHGHIRIGTFQRLAYERDAENMARLVGYVLGELYGEDGSDPVRLFELVVDRTARLAASYMAAGFVHGVLNSDNINVTGESFDYGPWRFAPTWDPTFTAAYFDHSGLYALARQPEAIHWDVMQLAVSLRLLVDAEPLIALLDSFGERYQVAVTERFLWRLGVAPRSAEGDRAVVQAFERGLRTSGASIDEAFHASFGGAIPESLGERLRRGACAARRLCAEKAARSPVLVRTALRDADRRGRDDLVRNRRARRLDAVPRQARRDPGHGRGARLVAQAMEMRQERAMVGTELQSFEPATGELLWRGMPSDVGEEVAAARAAWADWAAKPLAFRTETLRRFANVVRQRADAFADLIARETGKPLWEARTEVDSVIAKVDISITAFAERTPQRRIDAPMGSRMALRHKPHGVLAVLGPYNFPAHLPNGHIVPALLAGNAVVFKPSEKTPATGAYLIDCLREGGVPAGCVRLVIGGPDEGKALAGHAGIDGLLFTGSARTGILLNRQFADRPDKILALEMGGNNPIVVWDTPDLHSAAALIIQSAFTSAGQRCTAARRLIVDSALYEPLMETLTAMIGRLIVGAPHDTPVPFMGPVIDNEVADQLSESFLELILRGGRAMKHLERPIAGRPFLTPALIDTTEMRDRPDIELFGPILQVIRTDTFEAAIAHANDTRYGLSASLISQNPQLYNAFWANARAGIVNWNKPTNGASSGAPFGGIGLSGNHRPSAFYAADYCAYPVVSSEAEQARASIGIGMRDG